MHYYRDGAYNEWWQQESLDHAQHFDRMADIPAVYSSGWYDPFAADASGQFAYMTEKNSTPQRLVLGPWNHVSMRGKGASYVGEVEFGDSAHWGDRVLNQERFRWFDHWLKGIDTGVAEEDPVRIFVMGGGSGGWWSGRCGTRRRRPTGKLDSRSPKPRSDGERKRDGFL
jgi:hypothetical protein